jgi:hypothetical protein
MVAERHRQEQQRPTRSPCSLADRCGPRLADAARVWEPEAVMALLLAHQGGWDEMLFVAVPIVIFGSLLAIANRRASRIERQQPPNGEGSPGDEPG